MSIKHYRRQLEQELALEQANTEQPTWEERLESAGALEKIGPPTGGESDVVRLRQLLQDRNWIPIIQP